MTQMQLKQEILSEWNVLREPGDVKKLAELAHCSKQLIYHTFYTGKCREELFNIISQFYIDRAKNLQYIHSQIKSL